MVPKGVGVRLRRFGVDAARIREMEWWQEDALVTPAGHRLYFACTPARHFSGRGLRDHNRTLWASWVLQGRKHKVFHSGDSGYGSHFRQIGQAFGPFDLVLMENGQYSRLWKYIHMTPEQSLRAAMDLGALYCVPIHWGGFSLSTHDWWEPVERAQVTPVPPHVGGVAAAAAGIARRLSSA